MAAAPTPGVRCSSEIAIPSRRNRASRPARTNDDLPLPDGPATTTNGLARTMSSMCALSRSRPRKNSASSTPNASRPRNGSGNRADQSTPSAAMGSRNAVPWSAAVTTSPATPPAASSHTGAPLKPRSTGARPASASSCIHPVPWTARNSPPTQRPSSCPAGNPHTRNRCPHTSSSLVTGGGTAPIGGSPSSRSTATSPVPSAATGRQETTSASTVGTMVPSRSKGNSTVTAPSGGCSARSSTPSSVAMTCAQVTTRSDANSNPAPTDAPFPPRNRTSAGPSGSDARIATTRRATLRRS